MKIVVDVDGTIAEIHRVMVLEYGLHPRTRITHYDFFFEHGSKQKFFRVYKKVWNEKFSKVRLTDKRIPYVFNELKKRNHEIIIASNRGNGLEDTVSSLHKWLKNHNIPHDYIIITNSHEHKFNLGDVLIDDNPNLIGVNDDKLIIFDRHYNRTNKDVLRIKRFKELLDLF